MPKDFVMRGKTASGQTEVLNFSGYKPGYAYRLVSFDLFPSTNIGGEGDEMVGTVTAGKTGLTPVSPDFNDEALIASAIFNQHNSSAYSPFYASLVNDTYLITQNLILMVQNTSTGNPVNWQCRFEAVKMSKAEEAVTNYKQFLISDDG